MQKRILKLISLWLPPLILMVIIFKLSSSTLPKITNTYWGDFTFKKSSHVLFYGILCILYYRGLIGEKVKSKKAAIIAVLMTVFYGVTDEIHQRFVTGRESRLRDVFFDGLGATLTSYFLYKVLPKMPKQVKVIGQKLGLV